MAEEMSNGLSRQAAIDRLVELGLSENDADDQEAAIREQLRAIHRGARAIFRDLDNGLERPQAVLRFQELGLSREDALEALDSYRERKEAAQVEAQKILEGINQGLPRTKAIAQFRALGLHEPTAEHLVGLRCDATAHWYRELVWLGGLAALLGAALLTQVLCSLPEPVTSYLIPAGMTVYGAFFSLYGRWRCGQYATSEAAGDAPPGPFELVRRGCGRTRAVERAVELGVPPMEAAALLSLNMDGIVRIYRWFVILGVLATAWGLYQAAHCLAGQPHEPGRCLGAAALALWGLAGTVRGLFGWRRFSSL